MRRVNRSTKKQQNDVKLKNLFVKKFQGDNFSYILTEITKMLIFICIVTN